MIDFNSTLNAIGASEDVENEVKTYLGLVEHQSQKENPNKKMTVCVTGGEPLLRNDLEAAGAEIRKRGFNWCMVWNKVSKNKKNDFSKSSSYV